MRFKIGDLVAKEKNVCVKRVLVSSCPYIEQKTICTGHYNDCKIQVYVPEHKKTLNRRQEVLYEKNIYVDISTGDVFYSGSV